jgi:geranylgeranyl pyrophosphate synthase
MFAVSLKLGALTARADDEQLAALDQFGRHLGLAFQIVDDLLDVDGDESTLGKRIHKDNGRGKLTFPAVLGVEPSRRRAAESVDAACRAIECLGHSASALEGLARYVLERNR